MAPNYRLVEKKMLIKSGDSGSSCKFNTFFFIETTDSYLKKKKKVWAFQVVLVVKDLPANAGDIRDEFDPWVGKIPWRRAWQPTAVFLPGEFHVQKSLVDYSPWGHKELDTNERLSSSMDSSLWICYY